MPAVTEAKKRVIEYEFSTQLRTCCPGTRRNEEALEAIFGLNSEVSCLSSDFCSISNDSTSLLLLSELPESDSGDVESNYSTVNSSHDSNNEVCISTIGQQYLSSLT